MKFLAVFVALAAVAFGSPTISTWTINELAAALQDPNTDPAHIPYLEQALDQLMDALYAGDDKPSITVVIPAEPEFPAVDSDHGWPIPIPADVPDHIVVEGPTPVAPAPSAPSSPLVQIIVNVQNQQDIEVPSPVIVAEETKPEEPGFIDVWPVQTPAEEPGFIDVWPIQIPAEDSDHIDVWPIQIPAEENDHIISLPAMVPDHIQIEGASPVASAPTAPTAPSAPSSPLVQIIVNVQSQQVSDVSGAEDFLPVADSMLR